MARTRTLTLPDGGVIKIPMPGRDGVKTGRLALPDGGTVEIPLPADVAGAQVADVPPSVVPSPSCRSELGIVLGGAFLGGLLTWLLLKLNQ